jgi:DNA repair protein RadC
MNAVDLARKALAECGSLNGLLTAPRDKLQGVRGLGDAKYAQLHAVLEMSRRALRETLQRGAALSSPQTVRDYLRLKLQGKDREVFVGVFLDAQNRVRWFCSAGEGLSPKALPRHCQPGSAR